MSHNNGRLTQEPADISVGVLGLGC